MTPTADGHEPWSALVVGQALDALEPDDADTLGRHLPGCQRCRTALADAREVLAGVALVLPAVGVPRPAWGELLSAVETSGRPPVPADQLPGWVPGGTGTPRPPARRAGLRGAGWTRWLFGSVIAVLLAGLVSLAGAASDLRVERNLQTGALDDALACLQASSCTVQTLRAVAGPATAVVFARRDTAEAFITGLSADDTRTQTYALWQTGGGGSELVRAFHISGPGRVTLRDLALPVDVTASTRFEVTLQNGAQAPRKPGAVVLRYTSQS